MQVKHIAECSKGRILQYFQPSLSYNLSLISDFIFVYLKTGFTLTKKTIYAASSCTHMRICIHVGMPLKNLWQDKGLVDFSVLW